MTFTALARQLAQQESRALRGWARAGRQPPTVTPIDYWAEWLNHRKTSTTSFKGNAA